MFVGKLVFAQVMDFLPLHTFRRCVARYPTNTFSHLDQCLSMGVRATDISRKRA
jgi:Domain of unknown function (DUF4372)